MTGNWDELLQIARTEVEATLSNLPPRLQQPARSVPVTYESLTGPSLVEAGYPDDLLGLFVGDALDEAEDSGVPRQILLFLPNLWEHAEKDPETFRTEVHITYLHELGHFLGLEEDELFERGLE